MKPYRVEGGPAAFGGGEVVGLTAAQFEPRATRVELVDRDGDVLVCRCVVPIEFKVGEIVHLPGTPSKPVADRLVLVVDPAPAEVAGVAAVAAPAAVPVARRKRKP